MRETHHRMLHIEVDSSLLGVDAYLDGVIDGPECLGLEPNYPYTTARIYLLTGTRMLSSRAGEGRIVRSGIGRMPENARVRTTQISIPGLGFIYPATTPVRSLSHPAK